MAMARIKLWTWVVIGIAGNMSSLVNTMDKALEPDVLGSFNLAGITFHNVSFVVAVVFASLYLSNVYRHGTTARKLSSFRSLYHEIPLFFLLDFVYPWIMTLLTLLVTSADMSSHVMWRSLSALWVFTAIGWTIRGTMTEIYYVWLMLTGSSDNSPAMGGHGVAVPAGSSEASKQVQHSSWKLPITTTSPSFVAFNVFWIVLTFVMSFPTSATFIQLLQKLFGNEGIEDDPL